MYAGLYLLAEGEEMGVRYGPSLFALFVAACWLAIPSSALAMQHSGNPGSPRVYEAPDGVTPPIVIHTVDAQYSEEARKAKYEGVCFVQLIVDERGMPTDVHVARPIGMGLDEKAIEAVKQYRFKPGRKGDESVAVRITVEVAFRLPRG
jgi:TonB family protein